MSRRDDEDEAPGAPNDRVEELTAHLDLAWDLLDKGDLEGARHAADQALAIESDSPEAITALGAVSAASGDVDAALSQFERAVELDPDYVDPYLHAAELHIYPLGDLAEAIALCEAALDVAEEEDEYLDALLLKAEAQIEFGDEAGARATLADLPPADLPAAQFHCRAGRSLLDVGDLGAAERHLSRALEMDPKMTDALHATGLLHEARGDLKKMVQVFLRVREADLAEPPAPWSISRDRYEALAQAALADLPEAIRKHLENVPILAATEPAIELVAEGNDPRMMGFFSGVPYPEKSTLGALPHLDCVFLYQRNIERACRSVPEVEDEIRKTLIHEAGHFFGLSEEELEAMGLG